MTTAFIITLTLLLFAFIAYILKKGELDAAKDNYNELEGLLAQKASTISSKVDELLVTNEGLKNEIAGLNRKNNEYHSKLKEIETQSDEKDKELARFQAEAKDLRDEYDALQKVYDDLTSRLVTVYREMPAGLVSSRKAERLSVNLREYITETPTGVSLIIVRPEITDKSSAE